MGTLTLFRVLNGGEEDLAYVIGMNRIRAGDAELDSGIERYLVTSPHDDQRGITQTYTYFSQSSPLIQPLASSGMFILVVAALVAGTLAGLVANAAGGSEAVIAIASALVGASYFAAFWRKARSAHRTAHPSSACTVGSSVATRLDRGGSPWQGSRSSIRRPQPCLPRNRGEGVDGQPEGEEAEEEVAREVARSGASADQEWAPLPVHSQ